jgi:hypothetical protein
MSKYAALAFAGLLCASSVICAQQNGDQSDQSQFDAMLKQARDDARKSFVQLFTQREKQNEEALRSRQGGILGQSNLPGQPTLPGQLNLPSQSNLRSIPLNTAPLPPPPGSQPPSSVPLPGTAPSTPPGSTPNIYSPPPSGSIPPVVPSPGPTPQPPTVAGSSMLPPANPNIYR